MKRNYALRGLASVTAAVFGLSFAAGSIAEGYKSTLDTALGTKSESFVSESSENDPLYDKFKPSDEVLNEDGTGNSHALIQKAIDLNREQEVEGAVLLKNNTEDGQGLPLKEGSAVSLMGIHSQVDLLGSGFGVKANGGFISLRQALENNKTDFANTVATSLSQNWQTGTIELGSTLRDGWHGDEFEFEGAGFTVNPVLPEIYQSLNDSTYNHANNEQASNEFDPGEPSIKEMEGVNASFRDSFKDYSDAAIVVLARPSSESTDYLPGGVAEGTGASEPLALTDNEKDQIKLAKEASDNVIVLLDTASAMEVKELQEDDEIDAILWIGAPGSYGSLGIADILSGKVSPSGGLPDIFPTYNMSAPAMQNMGSFQYSNAEELITRGGGAFGGLVGTYIVEAEGMYTGYRYYETRYFDAVNGNGNADSKAGAVASKDGWNYEDEVVYGFGYGLSYTTFEYEMDAPEITVTPNENGSVDAFANFAVTVKNTGDVAGKTPVQIYGQAPYEEGGVEKVAIQLLGYDKTGIIEPGASETVNVQVDLQYIASYDSTYANEDGTEGTYILDPGQYYFSTGNGAHLALNNIMALQGTKAEDLVGESDKRAATVVEITEDQIAKTAFATSKAGGAIHNEIEYADWNHFQEGEVTYLSRADWEATWPKTYDDLTLENQELIDLLNGHYYTIATDDDTSDIKWGEGESVPFYQMAGAEYDDERWATLLDHITLEEAQYLATYGGPDIPGIESLGMVEGTYAENCGNGIAVNLNANKDSNAPWSISQDDPNGNWHPEVFASSPVVAASFNLDLSNRLGQFIGEESLFVGIPILWGPGLNTHRHAYNGRNGEYYSEDPILSGYTAMEFAIGAQDYGLIAAPKHFAFNDQETNRSGVAPYMTEQRAREVELRAYQIAFEATKYDTEEIDKGMNGLMISFSKIGPVECTASVGLMTEILQNEYGFHGYAVTDIYDDTDVYGAVITSGATCYDMRGMAGFGGTTTLENTQNLMGQVDGTTVNAEIFKGDANAQQHIKQSVHNILYAMSRSNLMNRYNSTTRIEQNMTWWRALYMGIEAGSGILTVLFAVLFILMGRKAKEAK